MRGLTQDARLFWRWNLLPSNVIYNPIAGFGSLGTSAPPSTLVAPGFATVGAVSAQTSGANTTGVWVTQMVAVAPGQRMFGSAWVLGDPALSMSCRLEWHSDSATVGTAVGTAVPLGAVAQPVTMTATAPAGTTQARLLVYGSATAAGQAWTVYGFALGTRRPADQRFWVPPERG